jgi:chromosome segregation ATPase
MKERIMVVRREEIKKQLEELRIEMEQSKSKSMCLFSTNTSVSAQYRKLATESSKLKQELKQLSKQLTTTLQHLERTNGEFTYRGFRYLDILSYEKLRHEQEEYENQKRDIQKKALRAR